MADKLLLALSANMVKESVNIANSLPCGGKQEAGQLATGFCTATCATFTFRDCVRHCTCT